MQSSDNSNFRIPRYRISKFKGALNISESKSGIPFLKNLENHKRFEIHYKKLLLDQKRLGSPARLTQTNLHLPILP